MRVVIAAAGSKGRWPDAIGGTPHLAPVRGEPLLHRTVRLARQWTSDVHVTVPPGDTRYTSIRDAVLHPRGAEHYSEWQSTRDLWNPVGRTVLLLGDVVWSESALGLVLACEDRAWRKWGRQHGSAVTGCRYGEGWAFSWWPEHHDELDALLRDIRVERDRDRRAGVRVHPVGWMLLRAMQGTDLRVHECLSPWFTDTSRVLPGDPTDDLDFAAEWHRHPMCGGKQPDTASDPVTVSMPYAGSSAPYLRRAVDAVLEQTHERLRLVVTCDGPQDPSPWPLLADITDPRLTRFDLSVNRGRYYVDAVVLAACTTPWWTVHDADDAAGQRWLSSMLAVTDPATTAIFTAQRETGVDGETTTRYVEPYQPGKLVHLAHMAGLWSTSWLRSIGGPHPGHRVGWDSVMTAVPMTPWLRGWGVLDDPLYHRYRHTASLTLAPSTVAGSPLRRQARADLRALWPKVVDACQLGPRRAPAAVRALVESTTDPRTAAAVRDDAARLRTVLTATR